MPDLLVQMLVRLRPYETFRSLAVPFTGRVPLSNRIREVAEEVEATVVDASLPADTVAAINGANFGEDEQGACLQFLAEFHAQGALAVSDYIRVCLSVPVLHLTTHSTALRRICYTALTLAPDKSARGCCSPSSRPHSISASARLRVCTGRGRRCGTRRVSVASTRWQSVSMPMSAASRAPRTRAAPPYPPRLVLQCRLRAPEYRASVFEYLLHVLGDDRHNDEERQALQAALMEHMGELIEVDNIKGTLWPPCVCVLSACSVALVPRDVWRGWRSA